jgi:DNA polymerase-1
MDSSAVRYLGVKTINFEELTGKGAKQITFNQVDVDRAAEYSAEDADITLQLHRAIWPQIEAVPALKIRLRKHRTAAGAGLVPHGAHGRARGPRAIESAEHRVGARMLELQSQAHRRPAAFSMSTRQSNCRKYCSASLAFR